MKILILGITGRTGRLAVEEAIKRGHEVVGIARNPYAVDVKDVEIFAGTPYEPETVVKAIKGCDAVISTLNTFPQSQGLFGKLNSPSDNVSMSIKNTIRVMGKTGINRIVVVSALGVSDSVREKPGIFSIINRVSNNKYAYADHDVQENVLERSRLDWTVVRPAGLTDNNENLSIQCNLNGEVKTRATISRKAVARFILDCVEKGQYIKQKPAISNS